MGWRGTVRKVEFGVVGFECACFDRFSLAVSVAWVSWVTGNPRVLVFQIRSRALVTVISFLSYVFAFRAAVTGLRELFPSFLAMPYFD